MFESVRFKICGGEWELKACVCQTIDVIDGESVGEVGHVCLLSERSFLLSPLPWTSIIQTLH